MLTATRINGRKAEVYFNVLHRVGITSDSGMLIEQSMYIEKSELISMTQAWYKEKNLSP